MLAKIWRLFLSHLSGEEGDRLSIGNTHHFLSHLSGEEGGWSALDTITAFLSHLSGEEAILSPFIKQP